MPKQKSSASSATKKKHARKAAAKEEAAVKEDDELQINADDIDKASAHDDQQQIAGDLLNSSDPSAAATSSSDPQLAQALPARQPPEKTVNDRLPAQTAQRGQKKDKRKKHNKGEQPPPQRKKQYIPPPKPPRGQVDPVDMYGLGVTGTGYERIAADKIVSLRLLNKKDSSSVERGLDELTTWLTSIGPDQCDEELGQISEMLPVWVCRSSFCSIHTMLITILHAKTHHIPRLSSHVSRRVRLSTASLQAFLLHRGPSRLLEVTLPSLSSNTALQQNDYLSSQLCSAFDLDRQVRLLATKNWQVLSQRFELESYLREILDSLNATILDDTNSTPHTSTLRSGKLDEQVRIAALEDQDRKDSYLAECIDADSYLLDQASTTSSNLFELVISSDHFWSFLSSAETESASVRRSTWRFLGKVSSVEMVSDLIDRNLRMISKAALESALSERDYATQNAMWTALVSLFQRHPQGWHLSCVPETDVSPNSSSLEEDVESAAKTNGTNLLPNFITIFLDFLRSGCYGNAEPAYQAIPLLLSTIPRNVFPLSQTNLNLMFTSFWAALEERLLESSGVQGLSAFTLALTEIVIIYARHLRSEVGSEILLEQLYTLWDYCFDVITAPSKASSLSRPTTVDHLILVLHGLEGSREGAIAAVWPRLTKSALSIFTKADSPLSLLASAICSMLDSPNEILRHRAAELGISTVRKAMTQLDLPAMCNFVAEMVEKKASILLKQEELCKVRTS